ncbi:hypothetical protein B0I35DRAFT_184913 [Stachybotrys elegans]|uniref:Zn(2)-C6 fungal-type domain-containing protein n=1 Tax=Stachybotrys elegans TaxID=80388 RepID=A0A8K0WSV2_9HYPO|nr:hypothetical protein B0I35DRAFT_184913 [Stachybotrys elegans]
MSLRRKSCQACFRGRRKCDLTFPTCQRCARTNKNCEYAYAPTGREPPAHIVRDVLVEEDPQSINAVEIGVSSPQTNLAITPGHTLHRDMANDEQMTTDIPFALGSLGLEPNLADYMQQCQWIAGHLRTYPTSFAMEGETLFIHKDLYRTSLPKPLRTAFGICGASVVLSDRTKDMVFRTIDAEIGDMARSSGLTLAEKLAQLQALILYQLIRLSCGDLRHQVTAQQQEPMMIMLGYRLLEDVKARPLDASTWDGWLMEESIRRTVVVAFLLYSKWFARPERLCVLHDAISKLPVSAHAEFWTSKEAITSAMVSFSVTSFGTFTSQWVASPREVDPFQRLLVTACRGIERVRAYDSTYGLNMFE